MWNLWPKSKPKLNPPPLIYWERWVHNAIESEAKKLRLQAEEQSRSDSRWKDHLDAAEQILRRRGIHF